MKKLKPGDWVILHKPKDLSLTSIWEEEAKFLNNKVVEIARVFADSVIRIRLGSLVPQSRFSKAWFTPITKEEAELLVLLGKKLTKEAWNEWWETNVPF